MSMYSFIACGKYRIAWTSCCQTQRYQVLPARVPLSYTGVPCRLLSKTGLRNGTSRLGTKSKCKPSDDEQGASNDPELTKAEEKNGSPPSLSPEPVAASAIISIMLGVTIWFFALVVNPDLASNNSLVMKTEAQQTSEPTVLEKVAAFLTLGPTDDTTVGLRASPVKTEAKSDAQQKTEQEAKGREKELEKKREAERKEKGRQERERKERERKRREQIRNQAFLSGSAVGLGALAISKWALVGGALEAAYRNIGGPAIVSAVLRSPGLLFFGLTVRAVEWDVASHPEGPNGRMVSFKLRTLTMQSLRQAISRAYGMKEPGQVKQLAHWVSSGPGFYEVLRSKESLKLLPDPVLLVWSRHSATPENAIPAQCESTNKAGSGVLLGLTKEEEGIVMMKVIRKVGIVTRNLRRQKSASDDDSATSSGGKDGGTGLRPDLLSAILRSDRPQDVSPEDTMEGMDGMGWINWMGPRDEKCETQRPWDGPQPDGNETQRGRETQRDGAERETDSRLSETQVVGGSTQMKFDLEPLSRRGSESPGNGIGSGVASRGSSGDSEEEGGGPLQRDRGVTSSSRSNDAGIDSYATNGQVPLAGSRVIRREATGVSLDEGDGVVEPTGQGSKRSPASTTDDKAGRSGDSGAAGSSNSGGVDVDPDGKVGMDGMDVVVGGISEATCSMQAVVGTPGDPASASQLAPEPTSEVSLSGDSSARQSTSSSYSPIKNGAGDKQRPNAVTSATPKAEPDLVCDSSSQSPSLLPGTEGSYAVPDTQADLLESPIVTAASPPASAMPLSSPPSTGGMQGGEEAQRDSYDVPIGTAASPGAVPGMDSKSAAGVMWETAESGRRVGAEETAVAAQADGSGGSRGQRSGTDNSGQRGLDNGAATQIAPSNESSPRESGPGGNGKQRVKRQNRNMSEGSALGDWLQQRFAALQQTWQKAKQRMLKPAVRRRPNRGSSSSSPTTPATPISATSDAEESDLEEDFALDSDSTYASRRYAAAMRVFDRVVQKSSFEEMGISLSEDEEAELVLLACEGDKALLALFRAFALPDTAVFFMYAKAYLAKK